jgi:hypothetical protein
MRHGLVFSAALTFMTAAAACGAQAAEWCGTAAHANSIIECGYSSESECENALNKAGVCFIDPDYVQNGKRTAPVAADAPSSGQPGSMRS